ncbi:MAG: TSUP family transporter [Ignavibacteriaceae bacterium]
MSDILIFLGIGLMAGLVSGMLGIGGGLIIVPALVGLVGFSQKQAQGTSLGLLLLPIGLFAVMNYYKADLVNLKAVGLMCITFIVGSYLSSKFAINVPEGILKKIFATFLLMYAIKLFLDK